MTDTIVEVMDKFVVVFLANINGPDLFDKIEKFNFAVVLQALFKFHFESLHFNFRPGFNAFEMEYIEEAYSLMVFFSRVKTNVSTCISAVY
ncbi:hypothetical protein D3C80_1472830 [compost metagenome]